MSGIDIFIAILSAVMFFGGLFLNFKSRKLAEQYAKTHMVSAAVQKAPGKANINNVKKVK